jgi:predicted enzyme related to lactoylglutathione lyase
MTLPLWLLVQAMSAREEGRGVWQLVRPQGTLRPMIRGMHGMFYASDAPALRAFFRDKLGLPAHDVGDGWLIMSVPEADLGVHPVEADDSPGNGTAHLSFYCDDIEETRRELEARGVEFTGPTHNAGFGLVAHMVAPGGIDIMLYQPLYAKA